MTMNNIFDNDSTLSENILDDSLTQTQNLDPLANSYDSSLPDFQPAPFNADLFDSTSWHDNTAMDNVPDQSMNTEFDSAQPDNSLYHSSNPHNSPYNSVSLHSEVSISNTPLPVTIVKPPTPINLNYGSDTEDKTIDIPDSSVSNDSNCDNGSSCYGGSNDSV